MYAERHARPVEGFEPDAMALLKAYDWPGNVRELENLVEAAVVLCEGPRINRSTLPVEVGGEQKVEDLPEGDETIQIRVGTPLPEAEKVIILDTLKRTGGNKTSAARILGIGLRTLYRKLEEYGQADGEAPPEAAP
jgi:DNA-binding NtrC family response regulator